MKMKKKNAFSGEEERRARGGKDKSQQRGNAKVQVFLFYTKKLSNM
jgi:hypothetical protein